MSFFQVQSENSVNVVVLQLPELIDPLEFDRINETMLAALEGKTGEPWVMDLAGVNYLGSSMLGLMVNVRQRIKSAGGRLVLCNMSPRLSDIFRACSMERLFTIARTRPEAIKTLNR